MLRDLTICALLIAVASQRAAAAATPAPEPGAVAAVSAYIAALSKPDPAAAFALLTSAQQRYFGDVTNFASNYSTTKYRITSHSILRVTVRNPQLVEVDVDQIVSFFDVATARTATATIDEPYFALRDGQRWGVKEISQPWKSYAPHATGRAGDLEVLVDRIEFFDHYVQVYCTLRNVGTEAIQVLPLLKSTFTLIPGATKKALNDAAFPRSDRDFYEGERIYPDHQAVGYITFDLASRADADATATLMVSPVIPDGAAAPVTVTVGPIDLPKLR
jgi:hypothetical protein